MQQSTPQAYLIIQLGNRWTDILRLQPGSKVVIGRSSDNQIVVRDERVSRHHAAIQSPDGVAWRLEDLGSRNGTQVDSCTIEGPHDLSEGQTITVGGCSMVFTRTLATGFSATSEVCTPGNNQATQSLDQPTIINRRATSQWSGAIDASDLGALGVSAPSVDTGGKWNFFYRLIYDLVACSTPEAAASVALDRLLEELGIESGGVITLEAHASDNSDAALARMAVLCARQPRSGAYHRISDFLVQTVARERQAILARNISDDANLSLARESGQMGVASIICAPLKVRLPEGEERLLGLMHVYSNVDEKSLSDADLELTVGVADNLAICLQRQEQSQELAEKLQKSLRKVSALEQHLEVANELVGESKSIRQLRETIQRAGATNATVLIRGESGVGKELVARSLHNASPRRDGPLVCLNCAALAPTLLESELFGHERGAFTGATERKIGKFEAAHGGTLLLDEIGEMSPDLQAKFLRVLEGQPFERLGGNKPIRTDVRVVAATNRNLEEAVKDKSFRSDLYFRLRVIEIEIPPLRARTSDVPLLVEHFLKILREHANRRITGIEPKALEMLARHSWPGNVRELKNVLERAIVLGNNATIDSADLNLSPLGHSRGETELSEFEPLPLEQIEREHIYRVLEFAAGNKTKAAQLLGIERSTLDRKLKRYG